MSSCYFLLVELCQPRQDSPENLQIIDHQRRDPLLQDNQAVASLSGSGQRPDPGFVTERPQRNLKLAVIGGRRFRERPSREAGLLTSATGSTR